MASLRSLILPNPHRCIHYVEIMTLNESSLNMYSPSPLVEASISEISIES